MSRGKEKQNAGNQIKEEKENKETCSAMGRARVKGGSSNKGREYRKRNLRQ